MILEQIQGVNSLQQPEMKVLEFKGIDNTPEQTPSMFTSLIKHMDNNIQASDKAMQAYILNQGISTHELMISMENAKHSLQLAVEVRNKLVESYEKITQISI
jgi:flagellar hook-basal body complex protein FliE